MNTKENEKNILEYLAAQFNKAIENDKRIVEMLLETNHDMIDLNNKIDEILKKWENK